MKQLIDCEQKHQSDVARKVRARRTRRLSGLVLLNVFLFVGAAENETVEDTPGWFPDPPLPPLPPLLPGVIGSSGVSGDVFGVPVVAGGTLVSSVGNAGGTITVVVDSEGLDASGLDGPLGPEGPEGLDASGLDGPLGPEGLGPSGTLGPVGTDVGGASVAKDGPSEGRVTTLEDEIKDELKPVGTDEFENGATNEELNGSDDEIDGKLALWEGLEMTQSKE